MGKSEEQAAKIKVPSSGGKRPEETEKDVKNQNPKQSEDDGPVPEELSEEDLKLKEDLEMAVQRLTENDPNTRKNALELLRTEIRSATSSMTSVPKPLKFLRPHYDTLKGVYENFGKAPSKSSGGIFGKMKKTSGRTTLTLSPADEENKKLLADILAVLSMTMAKEGEREALKFKLLGHRRELGEWGHEFVRHLAGEVGAEYNHRLAEAARSAAESGQPIAEPDFSDIVGLVDDIVPFHLEHNAEAEAVDLLIEVQKLVKLVELPQVDEKNYARVCLYLLRTADFMADPDDLSEMLKVAYDIYFKVKQYPDALRVALRLDDTDKTLISKLFDACDDSAVRTQMAYILARHCSNFELPDDDGLNEVIGNNSLHQHFTSLARDLDVMEPKTPADIYKSHLADSGISNRRDLGAGQAVDSAKANLASTLVNAFVNIGYGADDVVSDTNKKWWMLHKDTGKISAVASLGAIHMWDMETGLNKLDEIDPEDRANPDDNIRAGHYLGIGVIGASLRTEIDPFASLLMGGLESSSSQQNLAAAIGMGIAYCGSAREDHIELLAPIVSNTDTTNIALVSFAALSLGMIFVGTCNGEVCGLILQRVMESSDADLDNSKSRFLMLGLGLVFLGRMEKAEAMLEALKTVEHPMGRYAEVTLETCAYAGTGNVLKIQELLHFCAEQKEENERRQSAAVLGIALVTVGEDIGSEMALRTFDHLLHYGDVAIRRAVPIALALSNVSNPDYSIIDQLSRLTHDGEAEVSRAAILGLGITSAGTNNSRVAGLLRQLSEFYSKDPDHLFVVRIAQGLLHMGKGLMTINPFHSDRLIRHPSAFAAILVLMHCGLDIKGTLLSDYHYLLFYLTPAVYPRMLVTLDEAEKWKPTSVRVGQAVETVGQAGRPKTITGFQTHSTPVLLAVKERAELATNEFIPMTNVLEGVVLLRPNPDAEEEMT